MKKHVLALAVGVAAMPLVATAAPEIYGRFDVSLDKRSDYPGSSARSLLSDIPAILPPGTPLVDAWELESNSSRIGIRGSEELYNRNLRVIYQYETQADVDGDGPTFTTRNAFLGLDSKAGKFFAGNYDSVTKLADGDIDKFDDTPADMSGAFLGQHRNSNTLNWQSPSFGGMTFMLQAAPGEGDVVGTETKDGVADTLGASVTFEQDTLYAALAFEKGYAELEAIDPTVPFAVPPATVTVGVDTRIMRGSVGVSLAGGVEVGAIVELFEIDPDLAGADEVDGRSYLVSGKIAATDRAAVMAQLAVLDSNDLDTELTTLTLGGEYKLGKQTKTYALVSRSDVEIEPSPLLSIDESGNLFSVGLRHQF